MGTDDTSNKLKPDTKQTGLIRDEKGRIIGGTPPAGFNVNPQNRSDGGWKKENTISYQYKRFLNMSPEELKAFGDVPASERTVAMDIAYSQVIQSRKSLQHTKEITDRTEGKAPQAIYMNLQSSPIDKILKKFEIEGEDAAETDSTTERTS